MTRVLGCCDPIACVAQRGSGSNATKLLTRIADASEKQSQNNLRWSSLKTVATLKKRITDAQEQKYGTYYIALFSNVLLHCINANRKSHTT